VHAHEYNYIQLEYLYNLISVQSRNKLSVFIWCHSYAVWELWKK